VAVNATASGLAAVRIETPRLLMRPPTAADRDAIVTAIGHWPVVRWLARVPFPYRREDADAFLGLAGGDLARGAGLPLMIFDHDGLVGGIGLDGVGAEPEFGYWLTPSRWGRGYATEAGRAVLAHAFTTLGAARVRSGVFVGNAASLAVQSRLGFEVAGESRVFCLARGADLPHTDTLLTHERFSALALASRETI
jgi:RimJ/RimL family protein N-acetyltransferase